MLTPELRILGIIWVILKIWKVWKDIRKESEANLLAEEEDEDEKKEAQGGTNTKGSSNG